MKKTELYKLIKEERYWDAIRIIASNIEPRETMTCPDDILRATIDYAGAEVEHFGIIILDGSHKIEKIVVVTKGILSKTIVHPREIFRTAIKENAAAIILFHNHPSGSLTPSPEDFEITKKLVESGEIIGIPVIDHVIIGMKNKAIPDSYSMVGHGEMGFGTSRSQ